MFCPKCGEATHRSHARHLGESMLKSVSPYKFYRCLNCRWRGIQAPPGTRPSNNLWRLALAIVAVLILAVAVTVFG